jgi:transcription initiation factor TFIIIB Brf1 subunit/transcription initiation factor TFIIB
MVKKEYKCPECHSKKFSYDWKHSETICNECGTVIKAPYPYVAGKRVFYPKQYNYSYAQLDIHYAHITHRNKEKVTFYHTTPDYKIINVNRKEKDENNDQFIFNR